MSPTAGSSLPLLFALGLPALLWTAMLVPSLRTGAARVAGWSALPALLFALDVLPGTTLELPWVLLGMRFHADDTLTHGFLFFTALLWMIAGWFGTRYLGVARDTHAFWAYFLATLLGNLATVLAQDVASFYFGYALMTFAAFGLIVHERSGAARRAGVVYVAMALLGEMLLLAAFIILATDDPNPALRDVPELVAKSSNASVLVVLLLVGFGVKAGAVPLHMWLPLAHPVAPTPASAVLSGTMIKAGLLGCLRFLPLGTASYPSIGSTCVVLALVTAFYGAAVGVTQREAKTVLAYSSISQMGLMLVPIGVALASPQAAHPAKLAVLFYATNHALLKAALFLATGVVRRVRAGPRTWLTYTAVAWLALSMAGAPLSGGAVAKSSIKHTFEHGAHGEEALGWALSWAAVGTTLLMVRFARLTLWRKPLEGRPGHLRAVWIPWATLVVLTPWVLAHPLAPVRELAAQLQLQVIVSALWPIAVGLAFAGGAALVSHHSKKALPLIPAGDILTPLTRLGRSLARLRAPAWARARLASEPSRALRHRARTCARWLDEVEHRLGSFSGVGVALATVLLLLVALLLIRA